MDKEKGKKDMCCFGKSKFPTFAIILLVIGILWILSETKVLTVNIPWVPVVLVVIALGMIINNFKKK
ncbi:MAG: hypothetical protein ABII01_00840 [Candidatus Woesearchaeota archaeon]